MKRRKFETAKIEAELKKGELKIRQLELKKESLDELVHHSTACTLVMYLKIPVFSDKCVNIDAYLQLFERFARSVEWQDEVWVISLASLSQGKALDIYHQLTPTEANKFELVKSTLLKGFDCTAEGFGPKFRYCKFSMGRDCQATDRMIKVFESWTEMTECDQEYEALKELIIREQFLSSCDHNGFIPERTISKNPTRTTGERRPLPRGPR